ncbi:hypothetical protein ACQPXT_13560 [Streptomyces sp. CA-100214]
MGPRPERRLPADHLRGICGALWWFIDRKLRRFHWVVRWLFRIPLATAVVAALNFGNPVT